MISDCFYWSGVLREQILLGGPMHFAFRLLVIITEVCCCCVLVIFYFCFLAGIDILGHYLFILALAVHLWLALSICTSNCFGTSSLQLPRSSVSRSCALPSQHTCCVPQLGIDVLNAKKFASSLLVV